MAYAVLILGKGEVGGRVVRLMGLLSGLGGEELAWGSSGWLGMRVDLLLAWLLGSWVSIKLFLCAHCACCPLGAAVKGGPS